MLRILSLGYQNLVIRMTLVIVGQPLVTCGRRLCVRNTRRQATVRRNMSAMSQCNQTATGVTFRRADFFDTLYTRYCTVQYVL